MKTRAMALEEVSALDSEGIIIPWHIAFQVRSQVRRRPQLWPGTRYARTQNETRGIRMTARCNTVGSGSQSRPRNCSVPSGAVICTVPTATSTKVRQDHGRPSFSSRLEPDVQHSLLSSGRIPMSKPEAFCGGRTIARDAAQPRALAAILRPAQARQHNYCP